jgi:hypothetical protein
MAMICLTLGLLPASASAQEVTSDPDAVRLEVADIRRLARVVDSIEAGGVHDTSAVIERDYLALASPGLRVYAEQYGVTADGITAAISAEPWRYAELDSLADAILAQRNELQSAFRQLIDLKPGAVFPPIWFIVGNNGPGGLTRPEGVLIAAERYVDQPGDVVPLVLHELAHFQQAVAQGAETYRRIYGPDGTLLALALREGSAELIAELTTGRHINPAAERYGLEHEKELWSSFREVMHNNEPGDWMFVFPSNPEWPPDLGYWIGYRIAKSYYDQADDKRQVINDILALTDFDAFLEASGYAERVGR